jgi:uncharacterized membrane protein
MANEHVRSRIVGPNVPVAERIASAAIGLALVGVGLRRKRWWLGALVVSAGGALVARGLTGRCPAYRMRAIRKGVEVRRTVTVQASPRDVYALWRDLESLPRFMAHVTSVREEADGISRWVIEEASRRWEWRAQIVEDSPGRRLRWKSLPGGDLRHEGTLDLHEAPGDRGTIVDVRMLYRPPGGLAIAGAFGELLRHVQGIQLAGELARLRMLIETGEIAEGTL